MLPPYSTTEPLALQEYLPFCLAIYRIIAVQWTSAQFFDEAPTSWCSLAYQFPDNMEAMCIYGRSLLTSHVQAHRRDPL